VPASPLAALLVLTLLSGAATAQPRPVSWGIGVRRIKVPAGTSGVVTTPEVQIRPGGSTTFEFDSALAEGGVVVESAERFSLVDIGQGTIRLVPSEHIVSGERLRLTVRFRDGAAPTGAAFILVAHSAQAERLVEVWREKRTVESYEEEAKEARAEAQRCREENERLRVEQAGPGGLAGPLATGVIGTEGLPAKPLHHTPVFLRHPGNALKVSLAWSYRSGERVAVVVELENPDAAKPWTAEGALLESKPDGPLNMLTVWQQLPATPAQVSRVVIEAEATPDVAQGTFTLKLWEADGPRTLTLSGVTFP
jgi:uncharacterized protein (TIGR02268 family)